MQKYLFLFGDFMTTIFEEIDKLARRSIIDENGELKIIPLAERKLRIDASKLERLARIDRRLRRIDQQIERFGQKEKIVDGILTPEQKREIMALAYEGVRSGNEALILTNEIGKKITQVQNYFKSISHRATEVYYENSRIYNYLLNAND